MKKKGIGVDVKQPSKVCSDKKCPFHGSISIRGRTLTGLVINDKMAGTVSVVWVRRMYVPKYERYEKKRSVVKAHNPPCINAKKGDVVRLGETRPLSKTKSFVVIEVLGKKTRKEALKEEARQEAQALEKQLEKQKAIIPEEDKKGNKK